MWMQQRKNAHVIWILVCERSNREQLQRKNKTHIKEPSKHSDWRTEAVNQEPINPIRLLYQIGTQPMPKTHYTPVIPLEH